MTLAPTLTEWLYPLAFVLAGGLLGWGLERVLLRRLSRLADRTEWEWDDVVFRALKRAPTLLCTAAGVWAATQLLPLGSNAKLILERLLVILVIFTLSLVTARAAADGIGVYASRSGAALSASSLVTNITKLTVFVLGLLLILANLGINITALVTGLGIGGLAVALALQPTLANAFAGFQIIATRQVRHGDYIRLESGEEGYVADIRWRNTTIKALLDDHEVIVPNSKLSDSILVNYSLPQRPFWVRIPVGVSYGSDLEHVERVALEVAQAVWEERGARGEGREPALRFTEFADSSINFTVRILSPEFADQFEIRHEFVKRLHRRFGEEGITIPWPIRTLDVPGRIRVHIDEHGAKRGDPPPGGGRASS